MITKNFLWLVIWITLNLKKFALATNYDNYIAQLAAESQDLHKEFLRTNPRGQYVFGRLRSPEYMQGHPILGDVTDEENSIHLEQWRSFLRELEYARNEAARPLDEDDAKLDAPQLRWYKPEASPTYEEDPTLGEPELAPRKNEVAYQNHQWGEHKVSGGSGEIGQWLDFALTGAELQDVDGESDSYPESSEDQPLKHFATPESKTSSLPAYCDPPNPCPIGYDPDSLPTPCDPHVISTKEFNRDWILTKESNGECSCDKEHMYSCPADFSGTGNDPNEMYSPEEHPRRLRRHNPYLQGSRRKRLVAKKAFASKRSNPRYYWQGQVTKRVVKKDGGLVA